MQKTTSGQFVQSTDEQNCERCQADLQPGLDRTLSTLSREALAFEVCYMSTPMEGIQQTELQPSLKKIIHGNNVEMLNPPRRLSMSALCSAAKILIFELEVPILVIAGFS